MPIIINPELEIAARSDVVGLSPLQAATDFAERIDELRDHICGEHYRLDEENPIIVKRPGDRIFPDEEAPSTEYILRHSLGMVAVKHNADSDDLKIFGIGNLPFNNTRPKTAAVREWVMGSKDGVVGRRQTGLKPKFGSTLWTPSSGSFTVETIGDMDGTMANPVITGLAKARAATFR